MSDFDKYVVGSNREKQDNIPVLLPERSFSQPGSFQPGIDAAGKKLYEDTLPSIVRVDTEHARGSGFYLDKEGTVATCAHVVNGSKQQYALAADGRKVAMKIVKYDFKNDLAILKPVEPFSSKPLALAADSKKTTGEKVYALGYARGDDSSYISPGKYLGAQSLIPVGLGDADTKALRESLAGDAEAIYVVSRPLSTSLMRVEPGNSGGPMVTPSREVFAIASNSNLGTEGLGVPIEHLKELMQSPGDLTFEYRTRRSAFAQKYVDYSLDNPVLTYGATTVASGALGYGGYRLLGAVPKLGGAGAGAIGAVNLAKDLYGVANATNSMERTQSSLASMCDLSMVVGGLSMAAANKRTYGMAAIATGLAGRALTELIPTGQYLSKVESTGVSKLDPETGKRLGSEIGAFPNWKNYLKK